MLVLKNEVSGHGHDVRVVREHMITDHSYVQTWHDKYRRQLKIEASVIDEARKYFELEKPYDKYSSWPSWIFVHTEWTSEWEFTTYVHTRFTFTRRRTCKCN